ncbi:hypothetical protein ACFV1U_05715 [Streptomyces microflavus]|uniref:hypothetical protein n=1 Tax=Streptomyces microflavus TaxID=1919 RepID=UPI0036ADCB71
MAPSSRNTSNQQRIARALNRTTGCGHQEALRRVRAAADAGQLPAKLDRTGREEAARMLAEALPQSTAHQVAEPAEVQASPVVRLGQLTRGGQDKTVLEVGTRPQPGQLPLSELALLGSRLAEAQRHLRSKERLVQSMRAAQRELRVPILLPDVPQEVVQQMQQLGQQMNGTPRPGK